VHPSGNPHYMMDPQNAAIVAHKIAERLGKLDATHTAAFDANAKKFDDALRAALADWQKMMEPFKGKKVITYHKSFTYFLGRFGLELFDTIEPKPGIDPSPSHIAELIKKGKEAGIKTILIEENRPRRTADRVAQEIGAKVVVLHHMPEAVGDGHYVVWMREMIETLVKSGANP
jgi:zinc/manganese transport system substrate-binding protein